MYLLRVPDNPTNHEVQKVHEEKTTAEYFPLLSANFNNQFFDR